MRFNKTLSAIVSAFVAFHLCAFAQALSDYTYTTNNGTITITGYTGPGGAVVIPDKINGLPVTSFGYVAFQNCYNLTNITIPNSVTNIGQGAFLNCTNLTGIAIPNSVTSIGEGAFYICAALTNITIPNGVTIIEPFTFCRCIALTSISIPDGVTSIERAAFDFCTELTNIVIANSVTNIGAGAIGSCHALPKVTIPDSVISIGDGAFNYCNNLTSVTIPNSVTSIGIRAFAYCTSLTTITIPNSVIIIGDYAFESCQSLKGVCFQGNAPVLTTSFFSATNATVYYLPGATGWDTTYGGRPTAQWVLPNPQILNFGNNFGVNSNGFGFTISWATNVSVAVDACTNLANPTWSPLQTNTLADGMAYFSDPAWTNYPGRIYRLRTP